MEQEASKELAGGIGLGRRSAPTGFELAPDFEYTSGRYLVRFARNEDEVARACRLRYEVFNLELGEGLEGSHESGLDRDEFDAQCQHLLVLDTKTDEVVGTYRMQLRESADAGRGFYSATEFDLGAVPDAILDDMVELGRACTSVEHRTRKVLNLLWKGMTAYLVHHRKRYFFGCSSLTCQDPAVGLATHRWLVERGYAREDLLIPPLPAYVCEGDATSAKPAKVPTLFTLYLRLGARVCGPPAIDRFFGTIDFLTLIDTGTMDQAIFRSYAD